MGRSEEEWLPKYYAAFVIECLSSPSREDEKTFQLTISRRAGLTLLKWRMTRVHEHTHQWVCMCHVCKNSWDNRHCCLWPLGMGQWVVVWPTMGSLHCHWHYTSFRLACATKLWMCDKVLLISWPLSPAAYWFFSFIYMWALTAKFPRWKRWSKY